jgi:hypothetical protein
MLAAARLGKLGIELDPHQQQQPLVAPGIHPHRDTTRDDAGDPARHNTDDHSAGHDADNAAEHAQRAACGLRLDRPLDLGFELSARAPYRL